MLPLRGLVRLPLLLLLRLRGLVRMWLLAVLLAYPASLLLGRLPLLLVLLLRREPRVRTRCLGLLPRSRRPAATATIA